MKLQLKGTPVYQKNLAALRNPKVRIVVNEGGTGSSKTYSVCQLLLTVLFSVPKAQITVVRKSLPALRATAMKDFFKIMRDAKVYSDDRHNKSENIYRGPDGAEIQFISIDDPSKVRSRRQGYLYINEATELNLEDWRQLSLRTGVKIFIDYNPSEFESWCYDLEAREDVLVIRSNYTENRFLEPEVVREIEGYYNLDPNYWRVYGLGLRGKPQSAIYTHWQLCDNIPEGADRIYGLDFGFNNQTALLDIGIRDQAAFWDELIYERKLTNTELIYKMRGWDSLSDEEREKWLAAGRRQEDMTKEPLINPNRPIYADAAEPGRIEEIRQAGFWILPADKDVAKGIDTVQSHPLFITKRSANVQKEARHYKWKEKDGVQLDEPVKANDHSMDAGRYGCHTHQKQGFVGFA